MDIVDILLQVVIFAGFVVFGIAVWFIKKDMDKKKKEK